MLQPQRRPHIIAYDPHPLLPTIATAASAPAVPAACITSCLRCTYPPTASCAFSVQLGSSFAAISTALPCSRVTISFRIKTASPLQQSCPNLFIRYALRTSCLRCLGLSSLESGSIALWRRWRRRSRCSRTLWSVLRRLRCMRADALSLTPLAARLHLLLQRLSHTTSCIAAHLVTYM